MDISVVMNQYTTVSSSGQLVRTSWFKSSAKDTVVVCNAQIKVTEFDLKKIRLKAFITRDTATSNSYYQATSNDARLMKAA